MANKNNLEVYSINELNLLANIVEKYAKPMESL
jgi:hypothetical protein